VLWALQEFGYPYELVRVDPFKGETRTEDFRNLNPASKVPVLVQGDKVLTESVAIMEYLNDISPELKLVPTEAGAAYTYRNSLHYGLTEIEPYMWLSAQARRLSHLYSWPEGTYEEAISVSRQKLEPAWNWLEEREYIASDQFTLADIYYYHLITWAGQNGIDHPSHVSSYLENLQQRPQFPDAMRPD